MEVLGKEELELLMGHREKYCISIYIPTHRAGKDIEQGPIRLKNALREVQERLDEVGFRLDGAERVLGHAQTLLADEHFWRQQQDGLALFLSPEFSRHYVLPLSFSPLVVVAERFHLKPLMPLLQAEDPFYILALSQNEVRLLRGTRFAVTEVELEHVPGSLQEASRFNVEQEHSQQHLGSGSGIGGGRPRTILHGQGYGADDTRHKKEITEYFQQVNRGLHEVLRQQRAPLILAGVEYLISLYREVNTYRNLLDRGIRGNPELLRPEELHHMGWELARAELDRGEQAERDRYYQLAGTGRTSDDVREVLAAAAEGRVEVLFAAAGVEQWGSVEEMTGEVRLHSSRQSDSVDLLDRAAQRCLEHGGTVYLLEQERMPGKGLIAVIYRW